MNVLVVAPGSLLALVDGTLRMDHRWVAGWVPWWATGHPPWVHGLIGLRLRWVMYHIF